MKTLILGHRGMLGSAIHRLIPDAFIFSQVDWRLPVETLGVLTQPQARNADVLYLCAARVAGIGGNIASPGTIIHDNLMIQTNVIEAARIAGVKLIVFLGSSCIYPKDAPQPITEDALGTGPLEPTNSAYAIAKLAGIEMLKAYEKQYGMQWLCPMPCNLFGPGDNYDLATCHLVPALIRRFHEAKLANAPSVTLWGTGTPRREIMHVDDCAARIVALASEGKRGVVNAGTGLDNPISEIAQFVANQIGFTGTIAFDGDCSRDGVKAKLMSGGCAPLPLQSRIRQTYEDFLKR